MAVRLPPVSAQIFTRARPWVALEQTLRVRLRACFKLNESKQTASFKTLVSKKAVEFSGVAGEFCCLSLHRSQISKDL